jgi:hypothetical protein
MPLISAEFSQNFCLCRPVAFGKDGKNDVALTENPYTTWQKLEEMVEKGKVKNIGVAKYVPFIIYFH